MSGRDYAIPRLPSTKAEMRYKLRTLLIGAALAPPLLAGLVGLLTWGAIELWDWAGQPQNPVTRTEKEIRENPGKFAGFPY